jgi:basic amino acid/polyamine antiporter, APA family
VSAIIGAGIFYIDRNCLCDQARPALTLSFVLAAIGCGFAGLSYGVFAAMVPIAGSARTYSYATTGELPAWIIGIIGWDLVLEYAVGAATVHGAIGRATTNGIALPKPARDRRLSLYFCRASRFRR